MVKQPSYAIYRHPNYGPTFGRGGTFTSAVTPTVTLVHTQTSVGPVTTQYQVE